MQCISNSSQSQLHSFNLLQTDDQFVDSSESLCGQCRKLVKNESNAIECEIYQQWCHIKCQGIKKAEYECIKGGGRNNYLTKLQ